MIDALNLALQGLFPLSAIAAAVQGLLGGIAPPPEPPKGGGKASRPRGAWIPYHPMPRRRTRSRRDDDIIFL